MKGEDRSHALETILQVLCLVVEQVKCCVIVTEEGLPIASCPVEIDGNGPKQMIESTELAALAASLTGAGERTMHRLAQGKPGRLVLEGEAGTMLSFPVGDVSLAVLVASDANLAQVLFAAQKAAEDIESVLSPA
ncbi:MAG: roadblock/LC7 domain-containing protein [Chloroflexi bacterium]|nr:roadblock/LC7 domain-containing protein [Chloroflexota bacterium]